MGMVQEGTRVHGSNQMLAMRVGSEVRALLTYSQNGEEDCGGAHLQSVLRNSRLQVTGLQLSFPCRVHLVHIGVLAGLEP